MVYIVSYHATLDTYLPMYTAFCHIHLGMRKTPKMKICIGRAPTQSRSLAVSL